MAPKFGKKACTWGFQWVHTGRCQARKPGFASRLLPLAGVQTSFFPCSKSPQMQTPQSVGTHGAPWVSDSAVAVPWETVPTVHLRLWARGDEGRPLCSPEDAGCSFCHSLPYRAAFRLLWMVTGASGPIVLSQLSGISGDQWVRLCRSCFSGSLPFRNSFAPRESSSSCLGWLGDSFVLPELGKAAPAGPRIWLLACNLLF